MKANLVHFLTWTVLLCSCRLSARAQQPPQFNNIQVLTNREIALSFTAPTGINYRIEAADRLPEWKGLVTLPTTTLTSLQHTDSAGPFLPGRYYRTLVAETNAFTGDHLQTTNGDLIIHPLFHASFLMSWNGNIIYSDPADDATFQGRYAQMPKGNLILVTHSHTDHFSSSRIDSVRTTNAIIVVPQAVYNGLTLAQKALAIVLTNNTSTNVLGITIDAIPAYNSYHPTNTCNAYVLTLGGKRIFISGDTGNTPEMRALQNIDVAFVCMNLPYTMTVTESTNAVRSFLPKVIYPYHYRDDTGATANAATFKQRLGTAPGLEVRLRKWY
jgi:L-ascorbate metabolism protein UlaG (beta-lactamase superfamily)